MAAYSGSKYLVFGVTGLANLITAFSISSVGLALPTIAAGYQVSQNAISWLALVYSLVPCCSLLFFGRLGDLYGYRRQTLFGFVFLAVVFLLTPILSVNLKILIFFRCLQGLGYCILISIGQAILSRTFEASKLGKAIGINVMSVSIGVALGPVIGGILIEHFSWQAIFLFKAPLCIAGFLLTLVVLKDDSMTGAIKPKKDWIGSFLFALSIGLLIIGLNFSDIWGWLSGQFLICILGSVCSLGLFIKYEKRIEYPLMQLGFFKNAAFSLSNVVSVCMFLTNQMVIFLVPFFLVNILLLKSDHSGLIMLVFPIISMLFSPFGGGLTDKYGTRLPAMSGLFMTGTGCLIMSFLTESAGIMSVVGMLVFLGVGNAFSVPAINTAILSVVPREQKGLASGMIGTMRNLGQTLGVTCGSVIIAVRQNVYAAGSLVISNDVYLKAERDALYFGVIVICLALFLAYKIPEKKI